MKNFLVRSIPKSIPFLIFSITTIIYNNFLLAEELYQENMEINSSTKSEGKSSDLPTNPFEIVEMLRRANSLNDATKPSDAIDDALKSFNNIEQKENL